MDRVKLVRTHYVDGEEYASDVAELYRSDDPDKAAKYFSLMEAFSTIAEAVLEK